MTPLCPEGHRSETSDYCDRCGTPIEGHPAATSQAPGPGPDVAASPAPGPDPTTQLPIAEESDTSPSPRAEPCRVCNTARHADDRYCEACGFDFLAPPPEASAWEAVIATDRAQFERFAVAGLEFPGEAPARCLPLAGAELRIGRSRGRAGEVALDIDLAREAEDPGVSHLHALLVQRNDGGYAVRDLGSTNGTTVNDDPLPVSRDALRPLEDGDVLRLGVWTTLTIRARQRG